MKEIMTQLGFIWENYIWDPIANFSFWDALDILVLSLLLYGLTFW